LPDRIEGGPGVEPDGDDQLFFGKSDLIYWHLNPGLLLELEGLGWIWLIPGWTGIGLNRGSHPEPGWHVHPGEVWRVTAIDAPAPLPALVGATITAVKPLYGDPGLARPWWRRWREPTETYFTTGHIFETTKGGVGIAGIYDRYAVGSWPDEERWAGLGVVTNLDPRRTP
jgi:hypothetical protein